MYLSSTRQGLKNRPTSSLFRLGSLGQNSFKKKGGGKGGQEEQKVEIEDVTLEKNPSSK